MSSLRAVAAALLLAACGADDDPGPDEPQPLPPLTRAPLTTEERLRPVVTPGDPTALDPRVPADVAQLLADGYGAFDVVDGEDVQRRTLDGAEPPAPGASPTLLARFVHLADIQMADDESPARVINVDVAQGSTSSAFRPQEGHQCRVLNAAVRTINLIHEATPIDTVVLGGDNSDNAQTNEVDWVLSILTGRDLVDCDSGLDDDPVAGLDNDPKDPFIADGLAMPYLWVNGNHDVLNQGNFVVAEKEFDYLSDNAFVGARDWSQPGGPIITGYVPPDERRAGLSGPALLAQVLADGDGHGISDALIDGGRANYTFDVPGTPLRFVVLDTAAQTGGAEGLLVQGDLDDFLIPALDAAQTDGKLVVVTSHHRATSLGNGGGLGGTEQPDAITTDTFVATLSAYPNVLMHLAGHSHVHAAAVRAPDAAMPYWEVVTSALADYPHEMRLVEVWDLDNGFYGVRLVAFDYQTEGDPIAAEGKALGVLDYTSAWIEDGSGEVVDRNVDLYVPKR